MVYWVTNGDQSSEPSFQGTRYTTDLLLDFPELMNMDAFSCTRAKTTILSTLAAQSIVLQ